MKMNAMIDILGVRLDDPNDTDFSISRKIKALNNAQINLISLLDDYYLDGIKKVSKDIVVTNGEIPKSLLNGYTQLTGITLGDDVHTDIICDMPVNGNLSSFVRSGGGNHTFQVGDLVRFSNFTEATELNGVTSRVKVVGGGGASFKCNCVLAKQVAETTGGTVEVIGFKTSEDPITSFVVDDKVELVNFTEATHLNGIQTEVESITSGGDNRLTSTMQLKGVKGQFSETLETTGGTIRKVNEGAGTPIRNGVYKIYDKTNKSFARLVREKDFENGGSYGSQFCFSSEGKILINPSSCVLADVYYISQPDDFTDSETECSFGEELEYIILDLAESELSLIHI